MAQTTHGVGGLTFDTSKRHRPPERLLDGLVDHAHAAPAQLPDDAEIAERRGSRRGRRRPGDLLERCNHPADPLPVGEELAGAVGHLPAELGEAVAGQAAVEDALGVVHLAVPQQVDDGALAGPCRAGEARNACAVISRPM